MKQKIAFALFMGIVTTGIISFTLISVNVGNAFGYLSLWLKSWLLAYVIVIPAILIIGPLMERLVKRLFPVNNQ